MFISMVAFFIIKLDTNSNNTIFKIKSGDAGSSDHFWFVDITLKSIHLLVV